MVFVDAPGILKSTSGLNAFLQKEALDVIGQSDVLLGVISLSEKRKDQVLEILALLKNSKKPFYVVITKVDDVNHSHRTGLIREMVKEISPEAKVIEFSNKWGKDLKEVADHLIENLIKILPESPKALYDEDLYTPHSVRELAVEVIREKCFEKLSQEIPYNLAVRMVKFDESNPKMPKIYADILTGKESHKGIIVGKGAKTIKDIGMRARTEIEKIVGRKVFLKLEVVVRENWTENKNMMKDLGYAINDE